MRPRTVLLLHILLLLLAAGLSAKEAPAARPTSPSPSEVRSQCARDHLRAFMKARQIPGLSIAVGHHGEPVWAEAFGVADLDQKTPLTTASVFRWAARRRP